jgi:magnesium transporter
MISMLLAGDRQQIVEKLSGFYAAHVLNGQLDRFECHRDVNLISFDWYDVKRPLEEPSGVTIYQDAQDIAFIFENSRALEAAEALLADPPGGAPSEAASGEQALYRFFIGLVKNDNDSLEALEEEIISAEDGIMSSPKRQMAASFARFRRTLFVLKRYYEQLNTIFEGLVENENKLISEESLRHFVILDGRIDRLYENVRSLRDYVSQVREAYQAQIDIEQNSLMKTFTVITAIFLPLTLLVGWYGMNLRMPEFEWAHGYLFVIALSVVIVVICIREFKKRKWL